MTQILRTSKDVHIIDNRLGFTYWRWHNDEVPEPRTLLLFAHDCGPIFEPMKVYRQSPQMVFLCPRDLALYSDFDIAIQYYHEYRGFLRVRQGQPFENRSLCGLNADQLLAANDAVRRVIWRIELEQEAGRHRLPDLVFLHACANSRAELDLASVLDVLPDTSAYETLAVHSSRRMISPDESAVVYLPRPVLRHPKHRKSLIAFG